MNIFILDKNVKKNAEYHCDKHIVKMPLEIAQMIHTSIYIACGIENKKDLKDNREKMEKLLKKSPIGKIYGITHTNHPCSIWMRKSDKNFLYSCELGDALIKECSKRYGREDYVLMNFFEYAKQFSYLFEESKRRSKFPLAMPDDCKIGDAVESYREYYKEYKYDIAKWSRNETPYWF